MSQVLLQGFFKANGTPQKIGSETKHNQKQTENLLKLKHK